jgi:hypothetical protein
MLSEIKPLGSSWNAPPAAASLSLWFSDCKGLELTRTSFRAPMLQNEICAVRGKTCGAYRTQVTFQWTTAVQALCILLLRAAGRTKLGHQIAGPLLSGGKGSLASALDSSLYKQTIWLDLFGVTPNGDSLSRRILTRTNPGLRHSGPVEIGLNERVLPGSAIKAFLAEKPISRHQELQECADKIEAAWNRLSSPLTIIPGPTLDHPLKPY